MNTRLPAGQALAAAILALLCALQLLALLRMGPAHFPVRIEVTLAPGNSIDLGGSELAAPGAAPRALRLGRDARGHWWAASPQGIAPLRFEGDGRRWRGGSQVLRPGMRFQLGAIRYAVQAASPDELRLNDGKHAWRYDGATLWRDGAALPACPRAGLGTRLAGLWNRWAPAPLDFARPLQFGGSLSCGTRIGNAHAPAGSATLVLQEGKSRLAAATGPGRVPLLVEQAGMPRDLALQATPLDAIDAIRVGHARLRLGPRGDTLLLAPAGRVALSPEPDAVLPPGVSWHWAQRAPWSLHPAALPWTLLAGVAGALAAGLAWRTGSRREPRRAVRCGAGLALAVLGLGLLLAARAGQAVGPAPTLLLACTAQAYGLRQGMGRRANPVLACGVLLLAAGLLLQLELGIGAPDSGWLRYFDKTAALTTLGLGLLGCIGLGPRAQAPSQAGTEATLLALAAVALAALLAQVGWGDETGVFDLQPVEFAKLALTLLCAHCLALGLGTHAGPVVLGAALLRWLRLVAPALLFIVLLGVALVQVDDYSPLILLLVWGAAMLLAWACAARQRGAACAVLALAGICIAALVLVRGLGAGEVAQWRFYGERFGVWLAPAIHPHTGAQLLAGADAIAAGGWLGADGAFGLAAPGQGAPAALAIPAVQDDFAPSFLLHRHGLAGALALWTLQALFLGALLGAARVAWRTGAGARNHREAWFGRWRCFVLCGGAAFVFAHFLLSWGTNLAFFPIMGQPMSFLSAGGSHLLFFLFPLLAVGAAGEPSSEEI